MSKPISIRVADIIGSSLCISAEDGQKVFDKIKPVIEEGKKVIVTFERVTMLISLFLNASIGQLYGTFTEEEIRSHVEVAALAKEDLEILKRVVDNAKKYYSNPKGYDDAWDLEDDEDKKNEE